jgi:hypothetical protein
MDFYHSAHLHDKLKMHSSSNFQDCESLAPAQCSEHGVVHAVSALRVYNECGSDGLGSGMYYVTCMGKQTPKQRQQMALNHFDQTILLNKFNSDRF